MRDSLTAKIFFLTIGMLVLVSMITYGSIAAFLPVTYQNALEEDLQRVSEELGEELERYDSVEEAWNLLELFAASNQAQVTLLDSSGNMVFPLVVEAATNVQSQMVEDLSGEEAEASPGKESWDEALVIDGETKFCQEAEEATRNVDSLGGAAAEEADSLSGAVMENAGSSGEADGETGEIVNEVTVTGKGDGALVVEEMVDYSVAGNGGYLTLSQGTNDEGQSAIKNYPVKIGEETYSMLVMGTMQSVSQTMEILKQILPMILLVIVGAALICGAAASAFLTRPIMRLSRVSQKMASLRFDERCPENRTDEVGVLAKSLNELTENLDAAMNELRESNQKLRTFFAAASHELKTPVTILKGHLGGMCQNMGAYRDREYYLRRSYEVTETMERMVGEILAVSRMESGTWEARMEPVDLAELVRLQVAELMELLERKSMELQIDLPEHQNWEADRNMMIKVFRNLLVNAIRYSPEHARIGIVMGEQQSELVFWIENTGVHLPEASLKRIFDAFYRVEDSRNRKSGGSGLGLYIVKMVLEQHGAVYGAENFREGVRIWFRIPRKEIL